MAYLGTLPDIRIAQDGRSVAVRGMDGKMRIMEDGRNAFTAREWLAADADRRLIRDASVAKDVTSDAQACHAPLQGYGIIALLLRCHRGRISYREPGPSNALPARTPVESVGQKREPRAKDSGASST